MRSTGSTQLFSRSCRKEPSEASHRQCAVAPGPGERGCSQNVRWPPDGSSGSPGRRASNTRPWESGLRPTPPCRLAFGRWPRERTVVVGDTPADVAAAEADRVASLLFVSDRSRPMSSAARRWSSLTSTTWSRRSSGWRTAASPGAPLRGASRRAPPTRPSRAHAPPRAPRAAIWADCPESVSRSTSANVTCARTAAARPPTWRLRSSPTRQIRPPSYAPGPHSPAQAGADRGSCAPSRGSSHRCRARRIRRRTARGDRSGPWPTLCAGASTSPDRRPPRRWPGAKRAPVASGAAAEQEYV